MTLTLSTLLNGAAVTAPGMRSAHPASKDPAAGFTLPDPETMAQFAAKALQDAKVDGRQPSSNHSAPGLPNPAENQPVLSAAEAEEKMENLKDAEGSNNISSTAAVNIQQAPLDIAAMVSANEAARNSAIQSAHPGTGEDAIPGQPMPAVVRPMPAYSRDRQLQPKPAANSSANFPGTDSTESASSPRLIPMANIIPAKTGQTIKGHEDSANKSVARPLYVAASAMAPMARHLELHRPAAAAYANTNTDGSNSAQRSTSTMEFASTLPAQNAQGPAAPANSPAVAMSGIAPMMNASAPVMGLGNILMPIVNEGQAVTQRILDTSRGDMWLTDLASDIVSARQADKRLSFSMRPENLGLLDIDIASGEKGLSLKMTTGSEDAAHLLSSAQSKLTDELRSQNVRVAETEIQSRSENQSQHDSRSPPSREARTTPGKVEHEVNEEATVEQNGRFA